jgi:hypothetical protein
MLDQVKSGTTARIATAKSVPGLPGVGEAVRGRQIAAVSGAKGTDREQSQMSEQHVGGHDEPAEHDVVATTGEGDAAALPGDGAVQASDRAAKGAIASLLREAEALRQGGGQVEPTGIMRTRAANPDYWPPAHASHVLAAGAYSLQVNLKKRETVLRPGVIFSARF